MAENEWKSWVDYFEGSSFNEILFLHSGAVEATAVLFSQNHLANP